MSKDGEMVRKAMQCPYHRQKVKEKFDKMLKEGRISEEMYKKCVDSFMDRKNNLPKYYKNKISPA